MQGSDLKHSLPTSSSSATASSLSSSKSTKATTMRALLDNLLGPPICAQLPIRPAFLRVSREVIVTVLFPATVTSRAPGFISPLRATRVLLDGLAAPPICAQLLISYALNHLAQCIYHRIFPVPGPSGFGHSVSLTTLVVV